jgi:hypothetical protein
MLGLTFKPPGPVAEAFLEGGAHKGSVKAIMGPVGSAKTSTCLYEALLLALRQPASPIDGVRRCKVGVIRQTYRQIRTTVLPSWFKWWPKSLGEFSNDEPITHTLRLDLPGIGIIELIVQFIALGDRGIEEVLRGWEGTGVYLNELDTLTRDAFEFCRQRVGRYPSSPHPSPLLLPNGRYGVWADFNAPDEDNWVADAFVFNRPAGWELYTQPGGLIELSEGEFIANPRAENLGVVGSDYYLKQMEGKPVWEIRRMLCNKIGRSRHGDPVFSEYRDDWHAIDAMLEPLKGVPIVIGADAGLHPAAVFAQRTPRGQWRILAELYCPGMTARPFGAEIARVMGSRFPGHQAVGWGDPAAANLTEASDMSWMQIVADASGVPFRPARGNNAISTRLAIVSNVLRRDLDGIPGLLISRACPTLRRAFASGYRYHRVQVGAGTTRLADQPEKNDWSHIMDGLQCLLLGGDEYQDLLGRKAQRAGPMPAVADGDDRTFRPVGQFRPGFRPGLPREAL